jgi:hypothetical protein
MEDVEVVDYFMPLTYQDLLERATIDNYDFPWNFLPDMSAYGRPESVAGISVAECQAGFQHVIMDHRGDRNSEYAELFDPIVNSIRFHHQSEITVVRIKIGLVLPQQGVAYPHTDYTSPHRTLVYYVNDTDGDTVFYNEWNDGTPKDAFTVEQRVHPERGRAVLFNGLKYHSTEYPSRKPRAFVNYKVDTI